MAQDAKIMAAAHRRFQADREARQAELERRIEEIHRRLPRVEAIDRELGSTAARLVLAALRRREIRAPSSRSWKRRTWHSSGSGRSCWWGPGTPMTT